MKVLLSWLREFAAIEGEPAELADVMTDLGMVVESVDVVGPTWDGIIVAEVLDLGKHPEADRIQLVSVDTGDGEPLQICCGAFNMAVGDRVPLATLGTVMPGGMEIARRKMRGEWSNGMLCSATELELGEDADGIMVLDPGSTVGRPLAEALGAESDIVFDLDIEGNRPDALSVAGVARDLAARLGVPFAYPETPFAERAETITGERASIRLDDTELCGRFGVRVLDDITMGDTPSWMVQRLTACGVRSINAIVDISNYVMLELGQPNHTYDLDLVPDGALGVRLARNGESLTTLDDTKRELTEDDGVIVNAADEPIGLAGVMGGASTEIGAKTTSVILEAAVWDRMSVAHTSRRLGLRSEASTRFERGVDPFGIERALDRFAQLASEICGASVAQGRLVVDGGTSRPEPITVRRARINHLLNTDLDVATIAGYLDPIGFATTIVDDEHVEVEIPSWRPDATGEIDIVEEVGRHHGYGRSGRRVPTPTQAGTLTPRQTARRVLRRRLQGAGYSEVMPNPFLAPGDLRRAGLDEDAITLVNPLVADESVMRTSLLPGMLKVIAYNQSHRVDGIRIYELGRTVRPSDAELPDEQEYVAAAVSGLAPEDNAAVVATRLLHRLRTELGLTGLSIHNREVAGLHPTRSAVVQFRGRPLGAVGEVDPGVSEAYDVAGRVAWLELAFEPLVAAITSPSRFSPVSRYPTSEVDLAFVVVDDVPATDVARTLSKAGGSLLQSVALFDVYRGEGLDVGTRSLAYHLTFQALDRTLTDAEVADARQRCIDAAAEHNGAQLR